MLNAGGLWIGWNKRYEEPLAEQVIANLEKAPVGPSGYIEIPCGYNREALFSRSSLYGEIRWTLEYIRVDDDVLKLFPLHNHMPAAIRAIQAAGSNSPQLILF